VQIADTPLSGLGWRFLAANTFPLFAVMAVVWALWKAGLLNWRFARLLVIVSVMGNTVYLGFPVAAMRLGEQAIGYAAICTSLQNIFIFTCGFMLMNLISDGVSSPNRFLHLIGRNVVLWASMAGLAIAGFDLRLPAILNSVLSDIGKTTFPLSLFTIV